MLVKLNNGKLVNSLDEVMAYVGEQCGEHVRECIEQELRETKATAKDWMERCDLAESELADAYTVEDRDEYIAIISDMKEAAEQLLEMAKNYVGDFPFHVCFWANLIIECVPFWVDTFPNHLLDDDVLEAKKCWQKHGSVNSASYNDYSKEIVNW